MPMALPWRTKRDLTREQQWARGPMDMPFLMLTLLLLGIGLVMLLSASAYAASISEKTHFDPMYYFKRQAIYAVIGIVVMYVVSRIDYQHMRWMGFLALGIAIVLLIAVKVLPRPFAISLNGAKRWLNLGFTTFQPSEIAKIAVVIYFSASLSKRPVAQIRMQQMSKQFPKRKKRQSNLSYWADILSWISNRTGFGELIPYGVVLVLIAGLLMLEPHMSATLLIFAAAAAILFAAGIHWGWFVLGGSAAALGGLFFIFVIGYNSSRITVWRDPWSDPLDKGFQVIQSIYAVASGGVSGLGFGLSALCPAHPPGLLAGDPCQRPVRLPDGRGRHHAVGGAGVYEYRRRHQSHPLHGYLPALLQLRRNGPGHSAGGDGAGACGVATDPGAETGIRKGRRRL